MPTLNTLASQADYIRFQENWETMRTNILHLHENHKISLTETNNALSALRDVLKRLGEKK